MAATGLFSRNDELAVTITLLLFIGLGLYFFSANRPFYQNLVVGDRVNNPPSTLPPVQGEKCSLVCNDPTENFYTSNPQLLNSDGSHKYIFFLAIL